MLLFTRNVERLAQVQTVNTPIYPCVVQNHNKKPLGRLQYLPAKVLVLVIFGAA